MSPVEPDDIISAAPRKLPSWAAWLAVVMLLAAALAKSIIVAVHYRDEVVALRRQAHLPQSSAPPSPSQTRPPPPMLVSETSTLPSSRPLTVQVTAFTARSSAGSAWVIVTARVSGGRPHSRYELSGGDCTGNANDWTWAAGVTSAHGSADLTGRAVRVSSRDEYYLILSAPGPGQSHPGHALHGYFGIAHGLSAVHDGYPPCAP
jgi:hypothetical protein